MPDGLVHESEEKLRAHLFAHGDPLSDWTISGCVDSATIVDKFAGHFSASYCCNSHSQADNLRVECERLRGSYCGHPVTDNDLFDTEVVCRIISNIKRGKASGIEGMSVEHLLYSHPALNSATVLSRFTSRLLLSVSWSGH